MEEHAGCSELHPKSPESLAWTLLLMLCAHAISKTKSHDLVKEDVVVVENCERSDLQADKGGSIKFQIWDIPLEAAHVAVIKNYKLEFFFLILIFFVAQTGNEIFP